MWNLLQKMQLCSSRYRR
ncbi:hypothetical protein LINPERPRIM_LOCUS29526 [Linum perenne]